MPTTRNAAFWTLTAATLAATGCASTPEATALPQGLTVLEAEAGTLSLAYRSADVTIFMEARRGHETPEPYASAPDMPDYEIDTIFTDEAGYAFYTRMGGDGWVEPSWENRLAGQGQIAPPVGDNAVLFRLAGEAGVPTRAARDGGRAAATGLHVGANHPAEDAVAVVVGPHRLRRAHPAAIVEADEVGAEALAQAIAAAHEERAGQPERDGGAARFHRQGLTASGRRDRRLERPPRLDAGLPRDRCRSGLTGAGLT